MKRSAIALALLVAGAVLSGATPAARTAGAPVITVKDNSYSKPTATIKRNTSLRWNWSNTRNDHSVTSGSGNPEKFSSPIQSGRAEYTHKFKKTGTYRIFCEIHPSLMKIKVTVKRRG